MISRSEWNECCSRVAQLMTEFVVPCVTPLTMSEEQGVGVAWGTGNYVSVRSSPWLLTADHVSSVPSGARLAHLPCAGEDYVGLPETQDRAPFPIDAASFPLPQLSGLPNPDPSRFLPEDYIGDRFDPVPKELFFWLGFPGYYSNRDDAPTEARLKVTRFDQLTTEFKPVVTQAIPADVVVEHGAFDCEIHAAMHYPSEGTSVADGNIRPMPLAKGMSGSLLWDTNFVRAQLDGTPWGPEMARVCGVLWGVVDTPKAILVTKIEHVRRQLPRVFSARPSC